MSRKSKIIACFIPTSNFPDGHLPGPVCRSPTAYPQERPWCLTTDPHVRWQHCDIHQCGGELLWKRGSRNIFSISRKKRIYLFSKFSNLRFLWSFYRFCPYITLAGAPRRACDGKMVNVNSRTYIDLLYQTSSRYPLVM